MKIYLLSLFSVMVFCCSAQKHQLNQSYEHSYTDERLNIIYQMNGKYHWYLFGGPSLSVNTLIHYKGFKTRDYSGVYSKNFGQPLGGGIGFGYQTTIKDPNIRIAFYYRYHLTKPNLRGFGLSYTEDSTGIRKYESFTVDTRYYLATHGLNLRISTNSSKKYQGFMTLGYELAFTLKNFANSSNNFYRYDVGISYTFENKKK